MNRVVWDKHQEIMDGVSYPEHDYFLLEGMPMYKSIKIRDFFKSSHYKLEDFAISDNSYSLMKKCRRPRGNLLYYIGSEGGWIKKVVGHYIVKSHLNINNSNTISMFIIKPYDG